jgi:ribokinase
MPAPGRVFVVGTLNHDLLLSVPSLPTEGETVVAREERTAPGGKGANQAVAAARTGVTTTMVGAVGTDAAGDVLRRQLSDFGVDLTAVLRTLSPTGSAVVVVDDRGDNQIIVRPGANADLTVDHVTTALADLRPQDVVAVQAELAKELLVAAVRAGRVAGARVVLNWAPVVPLPADVVSSASIVVVNRAEAAALTDLADDAPGTALAEALQRRFGVIVVVTLGAAGSVVATSNGNVTVPSVPVHDVVDTTGAGDSYVGTLAAALAGPPADLPDAMAVAAEAASRTVEHSGAQPSPSDPDLTISAPR